MSARLGEGEEARGGVLTGRGRGRLGGGTGSGCDRGGCREGRRTCSSGRRRYCGGDCCRDDGRIDADGQEFLTSEVEREGLVGLKEAEFADLLGRDAAGGEVGYAAGVEFDADVGDVGFVRQDGQANGADFANR